MRHLHAAPYNLHRLQQVVVDRFVSQVWICPLVRLATIRAATDLLCHPLSHDQAPYAVVKNRVHAGLWRLDRPIVY